LQTWPTRIFKGAIVVFALVAGSLAPWSAARGPDPHDTEARKRVSDYEFGEREMLTNYEQPVCGEALWEPAWVPTAS